MRNNLFCVGVTGHRNLKGCCLEHYKKEVYSLLVQLKERYKYLYILSALSDGADRLVVEEGMKLNIPFYAILPLEIEDYSDDFDPFSTQEFHRLLEQAENIVITKKVISIEKASQRDLQYEACGQDICDYSDVMISLWDEVSSNLRGGTSETICYCLQNRNTIVYNMKVSRCGDVSNIKAQFKQINTF